MDDLEIFGFDGLAELLRTTAEQEIKDAATAIWDAITTDGARTSFGSPVASGRYQASVQMALHRIDPTTAPRQRYKYPHPKRHKYMVANLPSRTIEPNRNFQESRIASFKLGDTIFISNSLPYAGPIETDEHSWQIGGRSVFERSVAAAMARLGVG